MISKATRIALATTALAAAVSAHAQTTGEGLENFRLRPASPNIQGPTTPDNPIVERPAPQPQPSQPPKVNLPASKPETPKAETPKAPPAKPETARTAAPRANEPKPADASNQEPVRPRTPATGQPAPKPAADAEAGRVASAPAPTAPPVAANPAPATPPAAQEAPSQPQVAPAQPVASHLPPLPSETAASGKPWWLYPALALLLLCIVIAGLLFWRKRRDQAQFDTIMAIERPRLQPADGTTQVQPPIPAPEPENVPEPTAAIVAPEVATAPAAHALQELPTVNDHAIPPLGCVLETTSLSVSLVNATLAYQVTLANASNEPIRNLAVFGDLVSAHASVPMDEQLAGPGTASAPLHQLHELPAGQAISFNGQLRLPLNAIRAVRSEQAVMFIPLARMRFEAEGLPAAVIQTCVIGQKPKGPGAGLRPFRLDTGPRIYPDIGQRALDVPTPQAA